jgi:ABC-type protease/lipase transport system fused ATPase/permease subunit
MLFLLLLAKGEIVGFLGPNGAGKSTTDENDYRDTWPLMRGILP